MSTFGLQSHQNRSEWFSLSPIDQMKGLGPNLEVASSKGALRLAFD